MNPENQEQEFLQAYDDYADAIFRYCFVKTSNRELAIDLTQDTFTKAWQYLNNGNKIEQIRPFLYKIATNLIIDYHRKKKPISLEKLVEQGFDFTSDKDEQAEKEIIFESQQVIEKLKELDEKYRDIILLRYVNDLSIKEIADILNENENNVSVRIHRGLEKLKVLINK